MIRWLALALAPALLDACTPAAHSSRPADAASIERVAVVAVFLAHERPERLVFWEGEPRDSPILGEGALGDSLEPRSVAPAALALPVPVATITQPELEAHFRAHADAWEAWFARYPASGGVVEVTAPRFESETRATVVAGRLCGEHCRTAWRVTVDRGADGTWRVTGVRSIPLPRL